MIRIFLPLITLLILLSGCSDKKNEQNETPKPETRPLTFAPDEAFLDFIQQAHINYMWDGAEKTSGLAPPL